MAISALFIISLILRLLTVSPWLEDWDSVQFTLATKNFDMANHLPHPPGYAAYIFLGRLMGGNLTILSAILGAATIIPFYLLAKEMTNKKVALLTATIFSVVPIHWVLSEVALSNVPGMFFAVTSAYFIYRGKNSRNLLLLGSFFAGLTLGVRFAEYSILIPLIILTALWRKNLIDLIKSGIYFLAGTLVWLVPTIIDTGLAKFINLYQMQVEYIAIHDATGSFSFRLARIINLLSTAFTPIFGVILVVIAYYLLTNIKQFTKYNLQFCLVWFFAYLLPLTTTYNLEVPRHVLPLLPPTVLLLAISLKNLKSSFVYFAIFATTVGLFLNSYTLVKIQKKELSPTIAPVLYVKNNFVPDETTLITTFTYRQFQYYAENFKNYWGSENSPENITTKFVVTDSEKLAKTLPALSGYNIVDEREFVGDKRVFPRISETHLFILSRDSTITTHP